jgi:hypothetical protein
MELADQAMYRVKYARRANVASLHE